MSSQSRNYLNCKQALSLYNSYIQSHFNYCPLIWTFCNKTCYTVIGSDQKRALRALYNAYDLSLDELLQLDGNVRIHTMHIRFLMIEVFKTVRGSNLCFMKELFIPKSIPYCLRNPELLVLPETNTVQYGVNSLTFRGSILWNGVPNSFKMQTSLNLFKEKIKTCNSINCTCLLCKT